MSAPRHRDLARGMVAELDAIAEPAERIRFAVGAIAAMVRLSLAGHRGAAVNDNNAYSGGPLMPIPTTRQLLRRHAVPFGVAFFSLTLLLLANAAARTIPPLSERGASFGTLVEVLLLAVPHTVALTIPMAVFMAVLWAFRRMGQEGLLAAAQRESGGIRRLIAPVLGGAAMIAVLTLVSNTVVLPWTNTRLAEVVAGAPTTPNDRTMTVGELREAAQSARNEARPEAVARAVAYEVEIHKKFAIAAACMILALAGMALALRFPRGGGVVMFGLSGAVFAGYYFALMAGESLADRQLMSPLVSMWMANAVLLAIAVLIVWRPGDPRDTVGPETLAMGG